MESIGAGGGPARRRARRRMAGLLPWGRRLLAILVAAGAVVSMLGPASPAQAGPEPDPVARLQVFVKSFHIHDDRDLIGAGDEAWTVALCSADDRGICDAATNQSAYGGDIPFHASSGADVRINRVMPEAGDSKTADVTAEAGMPVYNDRRYRLLFTMEDQDFVDGDDMGTITASLTEANGWDIGTHTARSIHDDGSPGDYSATWEIRRVPLPDLFVKSMYVQGSGADENVCGEIRNGGQQAAPPAELTVETEGTVLERFRLPALDMGWSYPHCLKRSDLPAKQHSLVFSIDQGRDIAEMNELNNVDSLIVEAIAPAGPVPVAAPSPQPTGPQGVPSDAQPGQSKDKADLTVRAIRVNGQAPDGMNDCKAGKNDLTLVIKNGGKGDAGRFSVRLDVDGDSREATVDGLDAGKEREVSFPSLPLTGGQHKLTASVDSGQSVSESSDDNNDLTVTARCNGASY